MTLPSIRTVTSADIDRVIALLVLAFSGDAAVRWTYPDPQKYLETFPEFVKIFGEPAFEKGTAYCMEGLQAAALWFPPGVSVDEEALGAMLKTCIPPSRQEQLFPAFEEMGNYHPQEPHWYLSMISTDPTCQGRGYGSALLRHGLAECDRQQQLAYLEASTPGSAALYKRHGFEAIGTISFGPADVIPMVRKPQPVS
ncbi:MAG: GNAT family N-acetyltransferase [Cyanobacteriota bacterium]|nr:GNAT family N-acetyltransferase [Cyanobacteriota bacterium]